MKTTRVITEDFGLSDYESIYQRQKEIVSLKFKKEISDDYLLVGEHLDVYTVGRKIKDTESLSHLKNVHFIERGGEVTYHNPGQLVSYPIIYLEKKNQDIPKYIYFLEQCIIQTLKHYELETFRIPKATGVWIQNKEGSPKKIASLGIAISRWITYHGIAINVNNDLSGFSAISPCGFESEVMTSIKNEMGSEIDFIDFKKKWIESFIFLSKTFVA